MGQIALHTECKRLHGPENYLRTPTGKPYCRVCCRYRGLLRSRPQPDLREWMTPAQRAVASHPAFVGNFLLPDGQGECWPWRFARGGSGNPYGRARWNGRLRYAHRLSFSLAIPHGTRMPEAVCHRCDNPPCVNPEHLRAGTLADNTAEMWAKGRQRVEIKLQPDQVALIRARFHGGRKAADALGAEFGVSSRTIYRIFDGSVKAYQQPASAAA